MISEKGTQYISKNNTLLGNCNLTSESGVGNGYVASTIEASHIHGDPIILGLAASPLDSAPEISDGLRNRDPRSALKNYEHNDAFHIRLKETLIDTLGLEGIGPEHVEFHGNGSYGLGDEMFRLLKQIGYNEVFVPNYSFPNVSQFATRNGVKYTPIHGQELHPLSSQAEMLRLNRHQLLGKIVYVDYPNNPFGAANPELLRDVVVHAHNNGAVALIDLAFGDVLGDEFVNAIQFVVDHGGIALTTLSKTQGLPYLRCGRGFISPQIADTYYRVDQDQRLVFGITQEAVEVHRILYTKDSSGSYPAKLHAQKVADYSVEANTALYKLIEDLGLIVGDKTDLRVPIQAVIKTGELSDDNNLHKLMKENGIATESLVDYSVTLHDRKGYGHNAVRMLTPRPEDLEEVIRRIRIAMSL